MRRFHWHEKEGGAKLKALNPLFPPLLGRDPFSLSTFVLTIKRRGCVGIREIGTEHENIDIFLCACLAVPGLVYVITATEASTAMRLAVAVEFCMTSAVSVLADGLLLRQTKDASNRAGILSIDRKTAAFHVVFIIGLLMYRGLRGFASPFQLAFALALGLAALSMFYARLYYTYVEQCWRSARWYARIWHVGGIVAPLIGLLPRFL
mmetsp:Transcript_46261/g.93378  ORF Transcript_46261/g.93378 Transcript_46261/m.93378 type:complete len:207 (-) Transcript_46261:261-881(-)